MFDEDILLVSPPFSCGLGFVGDILLRLNIKLRIGSASDWIKDGDVQSITPGRHSDYTRHFLAIEELRNFEFPDRISVLAEHRMDLAALPVKKAALLIRDPIDCIFSWHRRCELWTKNITFDNYLNRSLYLSEHLPHPTLFATPVEIYALFVLYWNFAFPGIPTFRFEDMKENPLPEVKRLLEFLGCHRTDSEINRAVEASSHKNLREKPAVSVEWLQANQKSLAFEWQSRMSKEDRSNLIQAEPAITVCKMLEYVCADNSPMLELGTRTSRLGHMFFQTVNTFVNAGDPERMIPPEIFHFETSQRFNNVMNEINTVEYIGLSIDADELDDTAGINTALLLIREIFDQPIPVPVNRLARILIGLSSVFANTTRAGSFRTVTKNIKMTFNVKKPIPKFLT